MYLYAELWKARPAWLALPADKRVQYVQQMGPGMQQLLAAGIELVGFARNDADTPHRADFTYLALWKMPNKELTLVFERAIAEAGWHEYFEQVNARGELMPVDAAFGHMIGA